MEGPHGDLCGRARAAGTPPASAHPATKMAVRGAPGVRPSHRPPPPGLGRGAQALNRPPRALASDGAASRATLLHRGQPERPAAEGAASGRPTPDPSPRSPIAGPGPARPQYLVWARAQCGRRGEDAARRRRRRCVSLAPSRPAPAYLTAAAPRGHATWADSSAAPPRPMSVGAAPGTARRRRWGDGGTLSGARPGRRGPRLPFAWRHMARPLPPPRPPPPLAARGPRVRGAWVARDGVAGVSGFTRGPTGGEADPGGSTHVSASERADLAGGVDRPQSRPIGGRGRARRANGGARVGVARR